VPWPYIDDDVLVEFALLTRRFAQAVQATHEDATRAVAGIAQAHRSVSTEAMTSGWARMSDQHVRELVDGRHVVAAALEVAAGYVVAQKAEAIVVLVGMAEAFIADQAAAVATVFQALARDVAQAGERIAASIARLGKKTAEIEETNLARPIQTDKKQPTGLRQSARRLRIHTPMAMSCCPEAYAAEDVFVEAWRRSGRCVR
jgi:hypothetical protein